jgi:NAD+--asparagine ADP-ribosyltransferase
MTLAIFFVGIENAKVKTTQELSNGQKTEKIQSARSYLVEQADFVFFRCRGCLDGIGGNEEITLFGFCIWGCK